jgi:hypothetical protein
LVDLLGSVLNSESCLKDGVDGKVGVFDGVRPGVVFGEYAGRHGCTGSLFIAGGWAGLVKFDPFKRDPVLVLDGVMVEGESGPQVVVLASDAGLPVSSVNRL